MATIEQSGHPEHLADGHDARTADAHQPDSDVGGREHATGSGSSMPGCAGASAGAVAGRLRRSDHAHERRAVPSRHECPCCRSVCSIRVLRPNSVSTGSSDRQPDFAPQSPQPSHTRSLIDHSARAARARGRACARGAARPRTPGRGSAPSRRGTSASSRCAAGSRGGRAPRDPAAARPRGSARGPRS